MRAIWGQMRLPQEVRKSLVTIYEQTLKANEGLGDSSCRLGGIPEAAESSGNRRRDQAPAAVRSRHPQPHVLPARSP